MLRSSLAVLFIVVFNTASAQSRNGDQSITSEKNHPKGIIIFEDTVNWRHYIIKEHDFIRYRAVNKSKTLKGKITEIRHDTLFMKHRYIVPDTIDKIVVGHSRVPHFHVSRSRAFLMPDYARKYSEYQKAWKDQVLGSIRDRQALARTDTVHSNFIKLNLARLFGLEIAMSYERKINRIISLELEVGYGFPIYNRNPPGSGTPFEVFPYFPSEGFSVIIGTKIYKISKSRPGIYIEPSFTYKDLKYLDTYFPSNYSVVPPENTDHYPFGDKYTKVYGINVRGGAVCKYGKVIIDYYIGIGIREKVFTYYFDSYYDSSDSRNVYYHSDHSPVISKNSRILPVFNLGLKLGFGF